MKTRIIKTRYWSDSTIHALSKEARYLFIYLLSSPHINLCGIFELPDEYIKLETGITSNELARAKEQLEAKRRVIFREGWVYVLNTDKHNGYRNSPLNEVAYQRELDSVPEEIKRILNTSMDSTIDSTPIVTINKKLEIINKNKRGILRERGMIDELKAKFPGVDVEGEIEKMLDWLDSKGMTKKDYVAFARNWLRRSGATQRRFTNKFKRI